MGGWLDIGDYPNALSGLATGKSTDPWQPGKGKSNKGKKEGPKTRQDPGVPYRNIDRYSPY
jgi:hypothetical protein